MVAFSFAVHPKEKSISISSPPTTLCQHCTDVYPVILFLSGLFALMLILLRTYPTNVKLLFYSHKATPIMPPINHVPPPIYNQLFLFLPPFHEKNSNLVRSPPPSRSVPNLQVRKSPNLRNFTQNARDFPLQALGAQLPPSQATTAAAAAANGPNAASAPPHPFWWHSRLYQDYPAAAANPTMGTG